MTMRILHFADLHIGIENYGRPVTDADLAALPEWFAPGEPREQYRGYSTRLLDFLCAFDELVAYAVAEGVDLVLFSGDAYKSREPTQTHQREFAKRIARLAAAGVPVFLLVGNHDLPHAAYKATAVEIFNTLSVPQVTVADRTGVYRVNTRAGLLQVLALPWARRSALLARDEVRNLPYAEINALLERKMTELLTDEAGRLDPSVPSVLSAHVSLNTARLGSERTMMIGYDPKLLQSSLTGLPVDYIALGHIHRRQELWHSPPAVYPGSLQRVDFGEEDHEAKGFYAVEIDPAGRPGARVRSALFRPVAARAFVTVDVAVPAEEPDPTAAVLREVHRHHIAGAIVRVQAKLTAAQDPAFRDREVRQELEKLGAQHVAAVSRQVERRQRVRLGGVHAESQPPARLLELYLETAQVPRERRRTLLEYARRLMEQQEEPHEAPLDGGAAERSAAALTTTEAQGDAKSQESAEPPQGAPPA